MATKRVRLRNACFTWNNPPADAVEQLRALNWIQYACIGEEVGASGTPHLQGYLEIRSQKDFHIVARACGNAHIEPRRGTAEQASAYCRKGTQSHDEWRKDGVDGEHYGVGAVVHEWGEMSQQGHRSDIAAAVNLIAEEKASLRTVARECPLPYVKYHKGFAALRAHHIEPRTEAPEVTVLWGETGAGKSRAAREMLGSDEDVYVWGPAQKHWFDAYDGQESVIFEEFRGQLPFGQMLELLDRYTPRVEYKGGCMPFVAKRIVITSPLPPEQWYKELDRWDKVGQLMRRITRVVQLTSPKDEEADTLDAPTEHMGTYMDDEDDWEEGLLTEEERRALASSSDDVALADQTRPSGGLVADQTRPSSGPAASSSRPDPPLTPPPLRPSDEPMSSRGRVSGEPIAAAVLATPKVKGKRKRVHHDAKTHYVDHDAYQNAPAECLNRTGLPPHRGPRGES